MNFEDMLITDMKGLDEGFFKSKNTLHKEVIHQLSTHGSKPFIPLWAQRRMNELSDKNKFDDAVEHAPMKVVNPIMARSIHNVGSKRIGSVNDTSVKTPIVIHNAQTGEMMLIAGNHRILSNSSLIHTNTPVIAIPHEDPI